MQEIFDTYVENSFGEEKQATFKFKQFQLNYKKYFPRNKEAKDLMIKNAKEVNKKNNLNRYKDILKSNILIIING